MPMLVSMANTLKQFEQSVHGLPLHRCLPGDTLFVHQDAPDGKERFTFARIQDGSVLGIVVFALERFTENQPVFNIGYAVNEVYRGNGVATSLVSDSINELLRLFRNAGCPGIIVEAAVDIDNLASQRVAEKTISASKVDDIDRQTGSPIVVYERQFTEPLS